LASDAGNTEGTFGRPVLSEMSFSKPSDLATQALFKACTQRTKVGPAALNIGSVDNGVYMNFMTYEMANAMISQISCSGGGSRVDSIDIHAALSALTVEALSE
jgi:type VI secretion system secreted protein Hcp